MNVKLNRIRSLEYLITETRKKYAAGELSVNEFNRMLDTLKKKIKEVKK